MRLEGKSILITGASSGIGAATAKAAARAGARPILLARTKSKLDAVVGEITAAGGEAQAYEVDCADSEAVAVAARDVVEAAGVPDVIVNNAGAGRMLFFDETPPDEFERMMSAPFFAAVYVTQAFLPPMIERGSGRIVNVNAPISFIAWPGAAGYAAARWALRGLNDALRADLRGTGVHVSHVVCGKVASSYFEHNPGAAESIPGIARIMRTLTPDDVAKAVLQAIEREKRQVIVPAMLRLLLFQARIFPGPTEAVLRRTGKRRPEAVGANGTRGLV